MPKQLAFEQRLRNGPAIDRDEGLPRPAAVGMDHARDHLFAGARFSRDADGGIGIRDLLDGELLAEQLLQELETSPVQSLQRDLKARDRKLEDLTKQLEALKQIGAFSIEALNSLSSKGLVR